MPDTTPHTANTLDGLTPAADRPQASTETEIVAAIIKLKEQRDALPYGDVRWYDTQYEIYRRNQDLITLRRARQRK